MSAALIVALLGFVPNPQANAQATTPWGQVGVDIPGRSLGVALSGDGTTVVVGDSAMGVARVYRRDGTAWQQHGDTIDPGSDAFGRSVAIDEDGDTIIVGSRGNGGGVSDVARVYRFDGDWTQVGRTFLSSALGQSGASVDVNAEGTVIAVTLRVGTVGRVLVSRLVNDQWVDVGSPLLASAGFNEVALNTNGNVVAVSSLGGGTQVYRLSPLGNTWAQVNADLPSAAAVDINGFGNIVVLGIPSDNVARVYRDAGANWLPGATLAGERADDVAGAAVAISSDGSVIAIGAPGNDQAGDNAGHVRIYQLNGALWTPAAPDIDGEEPGDFTGWTLAMDALGTRIAIGAPAQTRIFSPAMAQDDSVSILAAESVLVDVLANDGFQSAALSVTTQPMQGVATVEANAIRYEPSISTAVTDSFEYEVCAGTSCSSATVFVSITPPTCEARPGAPLFATVWGTSGPDVITAGDDDDVIVTFDGDDVISTGNGVNRVCAGDGDDTVTGGTGDDDIDGGDGLDFIYGGEGDDTMTGGLGNDRIRGQQGIDTIHGGLGNDFLYGGIEGDTITGGEGNDTIGGFGGSDIIDAGPGNDTVFGGFGADSINAGDGNDTVFGLVGDDIINGGAGNDTLNGDRGQDLIHGNGGSDTLNGGNSVDTLFGDDGDDTLSGGKSDDALSGGTGIDTCTGNNQTVADTADATCEQTFGVP